ncbi:MAG TPA: OB-fold nucleic acid binding domain-containing protein, partial [Methanocorpusculum sp.]|nr:OB-fold nucleic acid binding domain-containing protein [Methanocorpusculum sp.]
MEKTTYVKDITNETSVDAPFAIKRADLRAKRGEQYLHITVTDRTGVIEAKFFGEKAAEAARSIKTGQVYRIIGTGKVPQGGSLLLQSESPESLEALLAGPMPLAA